jgi:resuscitation-promoting factor RpfB
MVQPPLLSEDTQPRTPRWHDTQPNPTVLRQRWWKHRGRWIALAMIGTTSLTLIITVMILLRPVPTQTVTTLTNKTLTLDSGSEIRTIQTGANTIANMLDEQGIQVAHNDAISHPLTGLIIDGMTVTISRARDITLTINGLEQTLQTPFEYPLDILDSAGVTLLASDQIWLDGTSATLETLPVWTVPVTIIEIRQAIELTIIDDGVESTISTTADTIGDALFDEGVTLYLTDIISPPSDTPITQDMQIVIDRAIPIQLVVDGVTVEARTNVSTVDDVLTEMNAPLFGLDYVAPSEDTIITENMTIEIIRVTEEVITSSESIPYEVIYQSDASMNLDQKTTIQAGQNGTQEIYTRIRYENGIEASRSIEDAVLTVSPVNEVIAYGTNIVLNTIDTPEGSRQYWRTFRVYATSYHPEALGGDDVTAIGEKLKKGVIGADPKIIPWRTEMYVPGYGVGKMADTGGPRSSPYWIDLGYSDEDWVAWYNYVDVYLLTPIPDEINYLLPTWTAIR